MDDFVQINQKSPVVLGSCLYDSDVTRRVFLGDMAGRFRARIIWEVSTLRELERCEGVWGRVDT